MSNNISGPLAVDITTAADLTGLSRAQFYRLFLTSGLLKSMKTGGRDRIIDYGELLSAYDQMRAALPRADLAEAQKVARAGIQVPVRVAQSPTRLDLTTTALLTTTKAGSR